jgi:shikimate 5-dehydrogenase
MPIAIVGAGNMARGISTRALMGGHTVTITAKDPGKAEELVDELRGQDHGGDRFGAGDESACMPRTSWSSRSPSAPPSNSPRPTEHG